LRSPRIRALTGSFTAPLLPHAETSPFAHCVGFAASFFRLPFAFTPRSHTHHTLHHVYTTLRLERLRCCCGGCLRCVALFRSTVVLSILQLPHTRCAPPTPHLRLIPHTLFPLFPRYHVYATIYHVVRCVVRLRFSRCCSIVILHSVCYTPTHVICYTLYTHAVGLLVPPDLRLPPLHSPRIHRVAYASKRAARSQQRNARRCAYRSARATRACCTRITYYAATGCAAARRGLVAAYAFALHALPTAFLPPDACLLLSKRHTTVKQRRERAHHSFGYTHRATG